ncbi:hypothetical protein NXY42_21215 [Bacteroides fragilis]|nr:hypothetical protein [Bacteroides fragilis]
MAKSGKLCEISFRQDICDRQRLAVIKERCDGLFLINRERNVQLALEADNHVDLRDASIFGVDGTCRSLFIWREREIFSEIE